jgi:DNA-binding SARP family transcriptional activator
MKESVVAPDRLVRVYLLNGFTAFHLGVAPDLKPGAQRLVGYLALLHRAVERRFAAFQLWPDSSEERAMANLRSTLWRPRPLPVALVDATSTHLKLRGDVWVDTHDGISAAIRAIVDDHALAGELLPDWYDDWILIERERLRQRVLHALEAACVLAMEELRHYDAIDLALRAVSLEPLRETANRLVIQAHVQEGNQFEARRHYAQFTKLLRDELGVDPSFTLREAATQIC